MCRRWAWRMAGSQLASYGMRCGMRCTAAPLGLEVAAPLGLEGLFTLRLRPTPGFTMLKRPLYEARLAEKRWLALWPGLRRVG